MRYLRLGTDFECNTASSGLGVVDSLGTSLNVPADFVIVAGGEGLEVVETVKGNSVFGGVVAEGSSVAGDVAFSHIVGSLSTNKEAIATEDGVGGEGGALNTTCVSSESQSGRNQSESAP